MNKVTKNRASKNKYLEGEKFKYLTIIEVLEEKDTQGYFKCKCRCDCGNETITTISRVKRGTVTSCGCLAKKTQKQSIKKAQEYA